MAWKFNPFTGKLDIDTQASGAGSYLEIANNLSDLASVATARTNLGLGSLALLSAIDISANTNLSAASGVLLTGDALSVVPGEIDHDALLNFASNEHFTEASINLDNVTEGTTNKFFTATEQTKLSGIETAADVTDETNVTDALDGATLVVATLAANDKVLIQDTDGSDVLKTVTAQAIADLAAGGTVDTSGTPVANDFARFTDLDTIEGRSYSEVRTDLGLVIGTNVLAYQAIGIADNNLVEIDSISVATGEYAKFTTTGLESKSFAEVKTDLGLNNVENTAHSTDAHIMTIDGRDVSVDGSKLDGIEALADVTDATNVNAAGATMNADTDISLNGWVVDEDNMASNLATKVPTQQSVKAYVDATGGAPTDATYITQTANGDLSAEQALGALSTGIAIVTTTTGVISTVAAPTGVIVGDDDTQTLTNKTLTTPLIDSISEKTAAAGVTTDGVLHKDGKVRQRHITLDEIQRAVITGEISTTNTSYEDATGVTVTFTPAVASNVSIEISVNLSAGGAAVTGFLQVLYDGAVIDPPGADGRIMLAVNEYGNYKWTLWKTGVTAAEHIIKLQWKTSTATCYMPSAELIVIPFAS